MNEPNLQNPIQFDSLTLEDVRKLYEMKEKENLLAKYNFPTKPSSDGYYHIWLPDLSKKSGRKQIKAKNLENLKEKVYKHEKGIDGSAKKTFKEVFALVIKEKYKYVKDHDKLLSLNNTTLHMQQAYNRFFLNTTFETKYVDQISKGCIENICYTNLKNGTVRRKAFLEMRGIIKQVLNLSYEKYWINENPYFRVDFNKYNDMLLKSAPIAKRAHSDKDLERMIEYLHEYQQNSPDYMPAYALELQILAGLRRGEIPPIEWSDVTETSLNINKEQILVRASDRNEHSYNKIVNHTKNYVDRSFPMTEELQDFFKRLKESNDVYYPGCKFCFPNINSSTGVISNNVVYPFYTRMCKQLGIEISKDFIKGPHSFRRNGITKVSNAPGGNIMIASILYGNSPQSASSHYYTGIDMETAKKLVTNG